MREWLSLVVGVWRGSLRGRGALVVENLLLRQQLGVALRAHPHPRLRRRDRLFWVVVRHLWAGWRRHLVLVRPETVLRWHRRGWRLFWWWRSRRPTGRPRLPQEVRDLIRRLSAENRLWGSERIRGELLKLGISTSNGSIRRYRWRPPRGRRAKLGAPSSRTTPTRSGRPICSRCRRSPSGRCTCCSSSRTAAGNWST